MKLYHAFHRYLAAALLLLLLFCSACAQPPEVNETSAQENITPYNPDGTCYTQSVTLPEHFVLDNRLPPHFTVVGDALVLTNVCLTEQTSLAYTPEPDAVSLVWDLTTNTLQTIPHTPILSRPDSSLISFVHIPTGDGGAVQLLTFRSEPEADHSSELPKTDSVCSSDWDTPSTTETILAAQNADGSVRFTVSVDALFNDGHTHSCILLRDGVTGYLYLYAPQAETLILDADGALLDRLPWTGDARADYVYAADNRVFLVNRSEDIAEWQYSAYDPTAHAFVPVVSPAWSGYRLFPLAENTWYEHTPEGFVLRTAQENGTTAETMLVSWVRSGFTDASIRETFVAADNSGNPRLYAITKDFDTGRASLTLFDPYSAYTAPIRREIRLYADASVHTLQSAVVAFNTENGLYRVNYTDSLSDADLVFVGRTAPLPEELPVLDLYPYLDNDMFVQRQQLVSGALSAFEGTNGALRVMPIRTALTLPNEGGNTDKFDFIASPADYLTAVLSYEALPFPETAEITPVLGLAIPETAQEPDGAWKFIRYILCMESTETLYSGADEGFSVMLTLFDYQLSRMNGAYAVKNGNQFTFTYPNGADPETFDPMTDINFASAAQAGAHYVRFDKDQRAVLEGFFGSK